jgi:ascorbate-specific PTS system EIIC-type component UlaA
MTVVVATFAVLFAIPALLPVAASAVFGDRTGERLAISIGAISGLLLLMSCGLLAYLLQSNISQQLSEDDRYLALSAVFLRVCRPFASLWVISLATSPRVSGSRDYDTLGWPKRRNRTPQGYGQKNNLSSEFHALEQSKW